MNTPHFQARVEGTLLHVTTWGAIVTFLFLFAPNINNHSSSSTISKNNDYLLNNSLTTRTPAVFIPTIFPYEAPVSRAYQQIRKRVFIKFIPVCSCVNLIFKVSLLLFYSYFYVLSEYFKCFKRCHCVNKVIITIILLLTSTSVIV